jgi:hypothetical protein
LAVDSFSQFRFIKASSSSLSLEVLLYLSAEDKPNLFPIPSCFTCIGSYLNSLYQPPYNIQRVKRIPKEKKEKKMLKGHTSGYPMHLQWLHLMHYYLLFSRWYSG